MPWHDWDPASPLTSLFACRPRQAQWNGQQREDIRRIERGVLDGWIGEPFFLWGAVGVVLLFVAMLLVGGAPTDSRCTLPWC